MHKPETSQGAPSKEEAEHPSGRNSILGGHTQRPPLPFGYFQPRRSARMSSESPILPLHSVSGVRMR